MKKILIFLVLITISKSSMANIIFKNDIKNKVVTIRTTANGLPVLTYLQPKGYGQSYAEYNIWTLPDNAVIAVVGEDYDLGRIELDRDKAKTSDKDIYVTFKSGIFYGYKYSIDYKQYKTFAESNNTPTSAISTPELSSPKGVLAKKFGVTIAELDNPVNLNLMKKVFGITPYGKEPYTFSNLNRVTKKMVDDLAKLKQKLSEEKRKSNPNLEVLFSSKIAELNEMLEFINRSYNILSGPVMKSTDQNTEFKNLGENTKILSYILEALKKNNE